LNKIDKKALYFEVGIRKEQVIVYNFLDIFTKD